MKIYSRLLLITATLIFFSCESEPTNDLSVSASSITLSNRMLSASFNVICDGGWTITTDKNWLTTDKSSGQNNEAVTVTAMTNYEFQDRTATVTVKSGKTISTVTVQQTGDELVLDTYELQFDSDGTPQFLEIRTFHDWEIRIPEDFDWCQFSKLSGNSDEIVELTPTPYLERVLRGPVNIDIVYNLSKTTTFRVSQTAPNNDPDPTVLISPGNGATEVASAPTFRWNAAIDPDGDICTYDIMVSSDGQTWTDIVKDFDGTEYRSTIGLDNAQNYTWKVIAKDIFGGSSESTASFTTAENDRYLHGGYRIYQEDTAGAAKPIHLVITGDGFTAADYLYGGHFDTWAEKAVEDFLSLEPFPTYRDHFKVTFLAAYSTDSGCTIRQQFTWSPQAGPQTRNTFYNCVMEGGSSTGISCNTNTVLSFAQSSIPYITLSDLQKTTTIVLINEDVYAGTCYVPETGEGIAMCPLSSGYFTELVTHEAGGHGFGRLLDEYIAYEGYITQSYVSYYTNARNGDPWTYAANWSFVSTGSHWEEYLTRPGYESVGYYEGAYFSHGVWRAENNSNLNNNIPYYNAPSRQAIVRRIMSSSGKTFNGTDFFAKDVHNPPASGNRTMSGDMMPPLAPPKLYLE